MMDEPPPRIDELEWDEWNLEHIKKHGITVSEVEEATGGDAIYRASYKNRLLLTAPTSAGQMVTVVIGESPHKRYRWYVFSARPASRVERREYAERKGDGQQ
jgi:uncharacterized DUF497 family protein